MKIVCCRWQFVSWWHKEGKRLLVGYMFYSLQYDYVIHDSRWYICV